MPDYLASLAQTSKFNKIATQRINLWQVDKEAPWLIERSSHLSTCTLTSDFWGMCQFYVKH